MRSALIRELSWGSVARATDGERDSVVCAVPSSGNCHGEPRRSPHQGTVMGTRIADTKKPASQS
jgi:hypothetical protein